MSGSKHGGQLGEPDNMRARDRGSFQVEEEEEGGTGAGRGVVPARQTGRVALKGLTWGAGETLVKCLTPVTRGLSRIARAAGDGFLGFPDLSCVCGPRPRKTRAHCARVLFLRSHAGGVGGNPKVKGRF